MTTNVFITVLAKDISENTVGVEKLKELLAASFEVRHKMIRLIIISIPLLILIKLGVAAKIHFSSNKLLIFTEAAFDH